MKKDKMRKIAVRLGVLTTYIIKMISDKKMSGGDTSKDEEIIPEIMSQLVGAIYDGDKKGFDMVREATDRIVKEAEEECRIKEGIPKTDDNQAAQA